MNRSEMLHQDKRTTGTIPNQNGLEVNTWHKVLRQHWTNEQLPATTILKMFKPKPQLSDCELCQRPSHKAGLCRRCWLDMHGR